MTGNAAFTAKALTNEESDALEMTLPVLPYGVKQRAAGAGVVFSGAGQNQWTYSYPAGSDVDSRGLTITVAPSVAGTVFDALDYLTSYPWGCTEQTMSSFLPDLIVAQAVDKLHLKSPIDRKTLDDEVQAGLERLYSYPARRWRLGLVARRPEPGVHDRVRGERAGAGAKLPATRSTISGWAKAQTWLHHNAQRASRHDSGSARVRGVCAGHNRRRAEGRARQGVGQSRQAERRRAGADRAGAGGGQ